MLQQRLLLGYRCKSLPAAACTKRTVQSFSVPAAKQVSNNTNDAHSYDTISENESSTLEVKRSKFIASAWPVTSAEQALRTITEGSDPAASHNCWAYKVGDQYRSSDDGEPSGLAGAPIQSAITSEGVDDVAVLVTRHFGGTRLGAGGLIRAYGAAAREVLRGCERRTVKPLWKLEIEFSARDIGAVYNAVDKAAATRLAETCSADGEAVGLCIQLPAEEGALFTSSLADTTSGRAAVTRA